MEAMEDAETAISILNESEDEMSKSKNDILDMLQTLSAIAEENAASTQESSASVTSITGIAVNIEQSSGDLKQIAMDLDEDMKEFKY